MNGAASISEVQLYATHDAFSEAAFYNSEILLCHTSVTGLSTSFEANYAGREPFSVRTDDTLAIDWIAPGWNGLPFGRCFDYNGTDNLLIEFRYFGEDGRTINTKGFYPPTPDRTLDAGLPDSPTGDLLTFMNSLRICYTPAAGFGDPPPGLSVELSVRASPCQAPEFDIGLPSAGAAVLELFSIEGRRVWIWSSAFLPDGENRVPESPEGLQPGIYTARLSAGGGTAVARAVIVR